MLDSLTNQRIVVRTDEKAGPCVIASRSQIYCIKELLDRADISYSESTAALQADDHIEDIVHVRAEDVPAVQKLLDDAVIRVEIRLVNGDYREYYESYGIIDRYDSLRQDGLEGKLLIHELFTDDWGPPPVTISLHGRRKDNRVFRATISYQ